MDVDSDAVEQAVNDGPADQSPEQILTRRTLDADLQAALDALPDAFRQAVWLRDVEELSYAEMAKVLGRADRDGDVAHFARPARVVGRA